MVEPWVAGWCWYYSNSIDGTKAVGTKQANELGIHDMSGNQWEWCWDVYDPYPSYRRIRGGGWIHSADFCTVASRDGVYSPDVRRDDIGFRLARSSGN